MSDPDEPNTTPGNGRGRQEVLSSLPRHRPQRLTARRQATREKSAAKPTAAEPKSAARKRSAAAPEKSPQNSVTAARPSPKPPAEPTRGLEKLAPKQGFAAEESVASGSVRPPSGAEMLISALHLGGAVGKGGVATGGRLLKGLLSRVPRV